MFLFIFCNVSDNDNVSLHIVKTTIMKMIADNKLHFPNIMTFTLVYILRERYVKNLFYESSTYNLL